MSLAVYTAIIATYTAAITTIILVWDIWKSRPKIQIKIRSGGKVEKDRTIKGIIIDLQNPSTHTARIVYIFLIFLIEKPKIKDYYRYICDYIFRFRYTPSLIGWVPQELRGLGVDYDYITTIEPGTSHSIFVTDQAIQALLESAKSEKLKVRIEDALERTKDSKAFDCRKIHGS